MQDFGVLTVSVVLGFFLWGFLAYRLFNNWNTRFYGERTIRLVGLSLFTVILGFGFYQEASFQQDQRLLTSAVRELVDNNEAQISCQRLSPAWIDTEPSVSGYVHTGRPEVAHLKRETCSAVRSWMKSDKDNPTDAHILGFHVLAHEAMHVAGEFNEAKAECYAMQYHSAISELLGGTQEQGQTIARNYYAFYYAHVPASYKSEECVTGGALHLVPENEQFFIGAPVPINFMEKDNAEE